MFQHGVTGHRCRQALILDFATHPQAWPPVAMTAGFQSVQTRYASNRHRRRRRWVQRQIDTRIRRRSAQSETAAVPVMSDGPVFDPRTGFVGSAQADGIAAEAFFCMKAVGRRTLEEKLPSEQIARAPAGVGIRTFASQRQPVDGQLEGPRATGVIVQMASDPPVFTELLGVAAMVRREAVLPLRRRIAKLVSGTKEGSR
jgi:hypothetical protein